MTTVKSNWPASDYQFNQFNADGFKSKPDVLTVDAFLLAQAAAAGGPKPVEPVGRPVVPPALEVTSMKPPQPGPAEAIRDNVLDAFQKLNDMDVRSKQGLRDFATRKEPSALADGSDGANPDNPLDRVIKSMEALQAQQREHLLALMAIQDTQSNMGMVTNVLKAGNTTFNKLISG